MTGTRKNRAGGWLFHDKRHIDNWVRDHKARVKANPQPLVPSIQDLKDLVDQDPALRLAVWTMFEEAEVLKRETPLGTTEIKDFDEFLILLNGIMTQAPEYTECPTLNDPENPCGLIGFPINALLDWPMATAAGYNVFANWLVNQQFKKILAHWSEYLVSTDSCRVLTDESYPERNPPVLGWLHPDALQHMVDVACCEPAKAKGSVCKKRPFEYFFKCDPSTEHYGYKSWDDFFTREFNEGVRPVASPADDNVIANACESGPLQIHREVSETDTFWLKEQPYSIQNMMNFDPRAEEFKGGTVYQAFLSALSYHRWHSPVTGVIEKAFVVNGTYYLENRYKGFMSGHPDDSAPNDSQPFLTAVATRAVIFIRADNPKIGLMCVVPTGMSEVSSCEITVSAGDRVDKGDQLGMFHFGGSTHCLVFGPDVNIEFDFPKDNPPDISARNIPVRSKIATVS